jgi:hypothetical protein
VIPDDQAARTDAMASQVLGMRGGNASMEHFMQMEKNIKKIAFLFILCKIDFLFLICLILFFLF